MNIHQAVLEVSNLIGSTQIVAYAWEKAKRNGVEGLPVELEDALNELLEEVQRIETT